MSTPPPAPHALGATLGAALLVTAVVTFASWAAPDSWAATLVGAVFLAATWWLVRQEDAGGLAAYGLAFGGLFDPTPLSPRRIALAGARSAAWAAALLAVITVPFWFGFRMWFGTERPADLGAMLPTVDQALGQLLVIALPEEVFFRGWLQTRLDRAFGTRLRILGADVGLGLVVTSAIFAVGHLLTLPSPTRLAVFFPALLFGWLRARTGSVGPSVLLHAGCNLLSAGLWDAYHLGH